MPRDVQTFCRLKYFRCAWAIAWESSRHFATPPLVSPRNDFWETSAEIPYRWRVITEIWVVLLIGLKQISHVARPIRSITQIWVVTLLQYGISALVFQPSFRGGTSVGVAKWRLFFSGYTSQGDPPRFFTPLLKYVKPRCFATPPPPPPPSWDASSLQRCLEQCVSPAPIYTPRWRKVVKQSLCWGKNVTVKIPIYRSKFEVWC